MQVQVTHGQASSNGDLTSHAKVSIGVFGDINNDAIKLNKDISEHSDLLYQNVIPFH
jgi:hypothetical protein